jgi:hypothetical protein
MSDFIGTVGVIVLIILLIIFAGFVNIWALNTLFPVLDIPYTFWTWLASSILFANITRIKYRSKKDD